MAAKFEMTDLGKLTYYLGIEVIQSEYGIVLKQERYATKILEEAGMNECNAVQTPMDSGVKFSKAEEEEDDLEDLKKQLEDDDLIRGTITAEHQGSEGTILPVHVKTELCSHLPTPV